MTKEWKIFLVIFSFLLLTFSLVNAQPSGDPYHIDPDHSSIGFSVSHLGISYIRGEFIKFSGTIQFDQEKPTDFMADITIEASSIATRNTQRNDHLKSPDFLDVAKFPNITFKSVKLSQQDNSYIINGDLAIHGVTKKIWVPAVISGPVKTLKGKQVIGIVGQTTINRKDFGVNWNTPLESGQNLIGDEVEIIFRIEAVRK